MNTLSKFIIVGVILAAIVMGVKSLGGSAASSGGIVTLTVGTDELEAVLNDAPWVSPATSGDKALYQVSFRTCPPCIAYHEEQFPSLTQAGIDTRLLSFARRDSVSDAEKATLADIYKTRDWNLSARWWERSSPAEFYSAHYSDAALTDEITASVAAGKKSVAGIRNVLADNGVKMAFPTHLWQNAAGEWRVNVGYSNQSAELILRELSQ